MGRTGHTNISKFTINQIIFSPSEDLRINYTFGGKLYILAFNPEASTPGATPDTNHLNFEYFKATFDSVDVDSTQAFIAATANKVRVITGFKDEDVLPESDILTIIDVAMDDIITRIDDDLSLLNAYHIKAVLYFACYLVMVAVYGPGIKSYRQDKNYVTFGDPYAQKRGSWFLQQYEDAIRKSGLIITKSEYDLRNYFPPEDYPIEDMKQEPDTYDSPAFSNS